MLNKNAFLMIISSLSFLWLGAGQFRERNQIAGTVIFDRNPRLATRLGGAVGMPSATVEREFSAVFWLPCL
jgi:hypothetical protein